jgi:integrase
MLFLSAEQVRALAEAAGGYRTLIYVLAYGGVRWGEAAAIRRRRCDLLRGRIEVSESLAEVGAALHFGPTKTHQARTVTLPRFLRTMLTDICRAFLRTPVPWSSLRRAAVRFV